MPTVIIIKGQSIDDFFENIRYSSDQRFHNYRPRFPDYPISEREFGELESMASHANHAGGGVIVNGHMASTDGGQTWVHVERLIR